MGQTTSTDAAAIVTDAIQQAFRGNMAALEPHPGLDSLRQHFPATKAAFPDLKAELQQQIVQGDRVATHWVFSGTHTGEFFGIKPTGKSVRFQNVSIARVVDGRIVQYNSEVGFLPVLMQIGALPAKDGTIRP